MAPKAEPKDAATPAAHAQVRISSLCNCMVKMEAYQSRMVKKRGKTNREADHVWTTVHVMSLSHKHSETWKRQHSNQQAESEESLRRAAEEEKRIELCARVHVSKSVDSQGMQRCLQHTHTHASISNRCKHLKCVLQFRRDPDRRSSTCGLMHAHLQKSLLQADPNCIERAVNVESYSPTHVCSIVATDVRQQQRPHDLCHSP